MPGTTPVYGITYPLETDRVADGAAAIRSTAETVERELAAADTRFLLKTGKAADSELLDGLDSTAFLLKTGKAADSELLDGLDSTAFLRSNGKAADSELLDGLDSTAFLRSNGKAADSDLLDGLNSTYFYSPANPPPAGLATFYGGRYKGPAGGFSVPNAVATVVTLDVEVEDPQGMHQDGATSRVTIPGDGAGHYIVSAQCTFSHAAGSTGQRRMRLRLNGSNSNDLPGLAIAPNPSDSTSMHVASMAQLAAGNFLELELRQDSGAAMTCFYQLHLVRVSA